MHIGAKIKELAAQNHISLAKMAKELGVTKQVMYDMVKKEDVSTTILKQLSRIYDTPIEYFFSESNDKINGDSSNADKDSVYMRFGDKLLTFINNYEEILRYNAILIEQSNQINSFNSTLISQSTEFARQCTEAHMLCTEAHTENKRLCLQIAQLTEELQATKEELAILKGTNNNIEQ